MCPRSASLCLRDAGAYRATANAMTRNESALAANAQPAPATATTSPPSDGPTARPILVSTELSAAACRSWSGGTMSGWIDCQVGPTIEVPQPIRNVSVSSSHGGTSATMASTALMWTASPWAATAVPGLPPGLPGSTS